MKIIQIKPDNYGLQAVLTGHIKIQQQHLTNINYQSFFKIKEIATKNLIILKHLTKILTKKYYTIKLKKIIVILIQSNKHQECNKLQRKNIQILKLKIVQNINEAITLNNQMTKNYNKNLRYMNKDFKNIRKECQHLRFQTVKEVLVMVNLMN